MFTSTMAIRLLHQARPWTVAAIASARPKGKLDKSTNLCEAEATTCCTTEDNNLMGKVRAEVQSQYQSHYSRVALKDHPEFEERMGSFSSIPIVNTSDNQDEDLDFPTATAEELFARCETELQDLPKHFNRNFKKTSSQQLDRKNKEANGDSGGSIRIFQWNVLSQALGTKADNFVQCNPSALDWQTRRWRIIEEIVRYDPDIICLQEVDHFRMLQRALGSIGYSGRFFPKPDSPCIYLESNTGPDGCVIFYKKTTFDFISSCSKVLEVWGVASNQVVLSLNLRHKKTGKEICVATTHLKARSGALLSTLRNEQGKDILEWLETVRVDRPVVLTGDFNDEPLEPVYKTMTENEKTPLNSAYKNFETGQINEDFLGETKDSLEFTSWKIRETGEQKHILDYIFHSPQLQTVSTLDMPTEQQIGEARLPSLQFASDHLSLVADLQFC
eukprot:GFUD01005678.1.p1 GENE.GFUD01005678.1~~GFUD01005678.1.p1  ORF type:complete len:445 (+),score=120.49 GFUD01005678.1:393-1727(+)